MSSKPILIRTNSPRHIFCLGCKNGALLVDIAFRCMQECITLAMSAQEDRKNCKAILTCRLTWQSNNTNHSIISNSPLIVIVVTVVIQMPLTTVTKRQNLRL